MVQKGEFLSYYYYKIYYIIWILLVEIAVEVMADIDDNKELYAVAVSGLAIWVAIVMFAVSGLEQRLQFKRPTIFDTCKSYALSGIYYDTNVAAIANINVSCIVDANRVKLAEAMGEVEGMTLKNMLVGGMNTNCKAWIYVISRMECGGESINDLQKAVVETSVDDWMEEEEKEYFVLFLNILKNSLVYIGAKQFRITSTLLFFIGISFKLPTIITRGNNVFGPHQYPEKLIPKFINMLSRNMDLPIHGSGEESRNFIYIDDVVSAFEYILHTGKIGEIYNIGTDYQISNNEVADKLIHIFGDKNKKYHVENRCFNDKRYLIDNSKLKQLGWNVRVSFDEGLSKTVEWYNKNIDHWGDLSKVLVPHPRN